MGECQVLPHLFWDMTMAELDFVWYGKRHQEEQDWVKFEDSILKTERSTSRKFYDFLKLITRAENISLNDEIH